MSGRNYGNVPLYSTTALTQTDPSTATLIAQLIIPITTSSNVASHYEVRFGIGASTGAIWQLECATGSGLSTSSIRTTENDSTLANQNVGVFTGSNQSAEFVLSMKAYQGDRFRIRAQSSFTGTATGWIQAEAIT